MRRRGIEKRRWRRHHQKRPFWGETGGMVRAVKARGTHARPSGRGAFIWFARPSCSWIYDLPIPRCYYNPKREVWGLAQRNYAFLDGSMNYDPTPSLLHTLSIYIVPYLRCSDQPLPQSPVSAFMSPSTSYVDYLE